MLVNKKQNFLVILNLLTSTIVAPSSTASKWQTGFNSALKGLKWPTSTAHYFVFIVCTVQRMHTYRNKILESKKYDGPQYTALSLCFQVKDLRRSRNQKQLIHNPVAHVRRFQLQKTLYFPLWMWKAVQISPIEV